MHRGSAARGALLRLARRTRTPFPGGAAGGGPRLPRPSLLLLLRCCGPPQPRAAPFSSSPASPGWEGVEISRTEGRGSLSGAAVPPPAVEEAEAEAEAASTCSHGVSTDPDLLLDDEDREEEMFIDPHGCLGTSAVEWGGPRRGGRFEEPTRFGDWERKGRCTDF